MSIDPKTAVLYLNGQRIGGLGDFSCDIESSPALEGLALHPDEQRLLDEEAALLDSSNSVRDEFLREHGGSFKAARDAELGEVDPPSEIITPSRLREYFRARGVNVTVTLEHGRLQVQPHHPPPDIGISLRKVDQ